MIRLGGHTAACRECSVEGLVVVQRQRGDQAFHVIDYIEHKESCSQYKRPQPAHLRKRTSVRTQEKRANSLVGAKETVASGAIGRDGDGRLFNKWRVESKQTKHSTYSVSALVWTKLTSGAAKVGEEPLLHVELRDQFPYKRICVIQKSLFESWTDEVVPDSKNQILDRQTLPKTLPLDPPAVALEEESFKLLKGKNEPEKPGV